MCDVPALRFPEFTGEWKIVKVGTITTKVGSGVTPRGGETVYCSQGHPFVRSQNVGWGRLLLNDIAYIDEETHKKQLNTVLELNDVLLNITGASIGRCAVVNEMIVNGNVNQHVCIIRSNEAVDSEFLCNYLLSNYGQKQIDSFQAGGNRQGLNFEQIKSIRISIPTLNEQKHIAELLCTINQRIETQNKIIEDLKKLKSAIVEMLFCKQGGVLLKLGDVGSFVRGLTYSSEDVTEDINATTVIRANNLNYGNNVNKEDVVYVNKKPTEIQILRKGDIVICMANGSSSLVGKNSYYSFNDRQSTIGAFCGIYRTSQPLAKWLMQSQRYKRLVYQSLQGGNGAIANLNGDDILNMTFRVVKDEKSVSILSTLGLIENSIAVNERLQELYSIQKEYLLQHLFI